MPNSSSNKCSIKKIDLCSIDIKLYKNIAFGTIFISIVFMIIARLQPFFDRGSLVYTLLGICGSTLSAILLAYLIDVSNTKKQNELLNKIRAETLYPVFFCLSILFTTIPDFFWLLQIKKDSNNTEQDLFTWGKWYDLYIQHIKSLSKDIENNSDTYDNTVRNIKLFQARALNVGGKIQVILDKKTFFRQHKLFSSEDINALATIQYTMQHLTNNKQISDFDAILEANFLMLQQQIEIFKDFSEINNIKFNHNNHIQII